MVTGGTREPRGLGPVLTLRVSRDGGRTWGPRTTYAPDRKAAPLEAGGRYPLCACPRCGGERHGGGGGGVRDASAGSPATG
ncbi:hypothetical protein GCM10018773_39990 [Streptomyces candidus]|nr:hypothetical protein GCM10018773_39990 [Streptomyces candidus]